MAHGRMRYGHGGLQDNSNLGILNTNTMILNLQVVRLFTD
jgi:hypothetical protein